jgi:putative peptide zinc metalloprotease protein
VDELIRTGAIVDAKGYVKADRRPHWIAWNPGGPLPFKLRLFCPDRVLCQPMVAWLRSAGQSTRFAVLLTIALLICACLSNAIAGPPVNWRALPWGIVTAALVIHVVLHECSHALACSFSNVKIRDIGIAILYWFLPVAYIDRTDSYRLRQPWQRLSIPIAGPLFDACAAGFTAIIALSISGEAHATMEAISSLQALLFLINLNPLLPTDGFHALEALTGRSNTRRRAFRVLLSRLGVLPLPPHLRALTRLEQRVYAIYGFLAAAYIAILSWVIVVQSPRIAQFVVEHSR